MIALTTDGKKTLAEGKLAVINNQVDTTSGTIRLKAVFDNKDHALWPGIGVDAPAGAHPERCDRCPR